MSEGRVHVLKCEDVYFDAVVADEKPFEVRRNDRGFQRGDIVVLRRIERGSNGVWGPSWNGSNYVEHRGRIGFFVQGGQFGIAPGYCVFTLEPEPSQ